MKNFLTAALDFLHETVASSEGPWEVKFAAYFPIWPHCMKIRNVQERNHALRTFHINPLVNLHQSEEENQKSLFFSACLVAAIF